MSARKEHEGEAATPNQRYGKPHAVFSEQKPLAEKAYRHRSGHEGCRCHGFGCEPTALRRDQPHRRRISLRSGS
jgi:hypothetical protein